jgi:hypothetical protein
MRIDGLFIVPILSVLENGGQILVHQEETAAAAAAAGRQGGRGDGQEYQLRVVQDTWRIPS